MNAAVLFSGGKDSTMALYKAIEEGYDVKYLVSIISQNPESYMFHVANIHLTELSAEAVGIPLIKKVTRGIKEEELNDLTLILKELKELGVQAIFSGALYSTYQKSRIDKICNDLKLESLAPLWHRDAEEYMQEIIDLEFDVIISSVSAEGLDESWLGKKIDGDLLQKLVQLNRRYGINVAFEGGEAETLVLDCPLFNKKIKIIEWERKWHFDHGFFIVKKAVLVDK